MISQLKRVFSEAEGMVGGERQRAYRYGMTLLCVGALFNWLGMSESNSEPVRFIGYTCLASGIVLFFMATCFWAKSSHRPTNQVRPSRSDRDVVINVESRREPPRYLNEKPPDYEAVTDMTPPPSYDDAILLSPAYLTNVIREPRIEAALQQSDALPEVIVSSPSGTITQVVSSTSAEQPAQEHTAKEGESPNLETSRIGRVLRYSSRLIRRTLSNVDRREVETTEVTIPRSNSVQDMKEMA